MNTIEVIHKIGYLLRKFGDEGTNIIKVVKLLVIADVYKMRKYGLELLPREEYVALRNGPVPSRTTDLLNQAHEWLFERELKMSGEMWERTTNGETVWGTVRLTGEVDEDHLTKMDKEVIDYAFNEYGEYTPEQLIDEVHKYYAWRKHEKTMEETGTKREHMDKVDFFADDGGPGSVEKDVLEDSRKYFLGTY